MDNHLALWAALVAFFGNLIAYKVVGLMADGNYTLGISALVTALVVAGAVYAKQKWDDEKEARKDSKGGNGAP